MSYKGKIYSPSEIANFRYGSTNCQCCKYNYTIKKGMLFDKDGPNRVRLEYINLYLEKPCKVCNPLYVKDMNNAIQSTIEELRFDLYDTWDHGWDNMFH